MKKILAVLVAVSVLGLGAVAFAHGMGYGGGYGMMGSGGGYGMMGYGGGYGMMGTGPGYDNETSEFLEKTADLRKEFHNKRFEYMEAWRTGDEKKVEKLAKELDDISKKLYAEAPKTERGFNRGGYCW